MQSQKATSRTSTSAPRSNPQTTQTRVTYTAAASSADEDEDQVVQDSNSVDESSQIPDVQDSLQEQLKTLEKEHRLGQETHPSSSLQQQHHARTPYFTTAADE